MREAKAQRIHTYRGQYRGFVLHALAALAALGSFGPPGVASAAQPPKLPGSPPDSHIPPQSYSPRPALAHSCDPHLSPDCPAILHMSLLVGPAQREAARLWSGTPAHWPTDPLPLTPDRGTIHKVVESREGERSLVFNIMEIQPFHHPAAIQAMSLDTERVSLPCPLQPARLPGGWGTELLCM